MKNKYKLRADWSKKEKDIMLHYPLGISTSCDGGYIQSFFNNEFIKEMKARGYLIETLKFSICLDPTRTDRFPTLIKELSEEIDEKFNHLKAAGLHAK